MLTASSTVKTARAFHHPANATDVETVVPVSMSLTALGSLQPNHLGGLATSTNTLAAMDLAFPVTSSATVPPSAPTDRMKVTVVSS